MSVLRETHLMLHSGIARKRITLPYLSLEYFLTNVKGGPIICYDPPCKSPQMNSKARLTK